jgi:hypothetical protein
MGFKTLYQLEIVITGVLHSVNGVQSDFQLVKGHHCMITGRGVPPSYELFFNSIEYRYIECKS